MEFLQNNAESIVWAAILAFTIVAELATATLVSVWFAIGAAAALLLALLGAPLWLQIGTAIAISIATLWFFRHFIIRVGNKGDKTEVVAKHALAGKSAIVTQRISNIENIGQICVDGDYWTAKSASDTPIAEGAAVIILQVGSAVCVVEPDPIRSGD
ncbi:MAG: NfeD family protein [Bradymonadales bacterium]|jgi:membrane protein implicated in regulation of membrane protease activity